MENRAYLTVYFQYLTVNYIIIINFRMFCADAQSSRRTISQQSLYIAYINGSLRHNGILSAMQQWNHLIRQHLSLVSTSFTSPYRMICKFLILRLVRSFNNVLALTINVNRLIKSAILN